MKFTKVLASRIRRVLRKIGLDLVLFNNRNPDFVLQRELYRHGIEICLDVGANRGQFAARMRRYGFRGVIHSFEPIPEAFGELASRAARDKKWFAHQLALGCTQGEAPFFLAANDQTSSLHRPTSLNLESTPTARTQRMLKVQVCRLDQVLEDLGLDPSRCFLKLDVQGGEADVLAGAEGALGQIPLIQLETSFEPLYENERSFSDLLAYLKAAGFSLVSLIPGYCDPRTGALLQVDAIVSRLPRDAEISPRTQE
ncbi:MAG: hypothetical protein KatS3mg119_1950 [Rhodothalassiaceae bacterium]|nr:MAG: hypothetical protein KatS3mg119_1950 [Rhodothalassiaceae bacterium]